MILMKARPRRCFRLDKVPHDPHVAVTSLREGGAVGQGTVVVYQPLTAVRGVEYTTDLAGIKSICGCDIHWRLKGVYRPKAVLSPELTASNAASLGKVVMRPHSYVAWLQPQRYCWVPVVAKVTPSYASPEEDGSTTWQWRPMAAPRQVPSAARSPRRRSSGQPHTCSTPVRLAVRFTLWMPPS